MKKLIFITLFSVFVSTLFGQDLNNSVKNKAKITRSTIGINGISKTFKTEKGTYIVSQSVGQYSVIGTFSKDGYTVRQGFQQPFLTAKIVAPVDDNSFSAKLFPNPFTESLHMSFDVTVEHDLFVFVYDVNGNKVYSNKYPPQQLLSIKLNFLPSGQYILKVITNKKQFISNLIKH